MKIYITIVDPIEHKERLAKGISTLNENSIDIRIISFI